MTNQDYGQEEIFKIESTHTFPTTIVDAEGRVYFDVSAASALNRGLVMLQAQHRERFIHDDGKTYYEASLLRRNLPAASLKYFDEMVKMRRQYARNWRRAKTMRSTKPARSLLQ